MGAGRIGTAPGISKGLADSEYLQVDGGNSPTANIDWGGFRITNLGDPVDSGDAVNKGFADGEYLKLDASNDPITGNLLLQPTGGDQNLALDVDVGDIAARTDIVDFDVNVDGANSNEMNVLNVQLNVPNTNANNHTSFAAANMRVDYDGTGDVDVLRGLNFIIEAKSSGDIGDIIGARGQSSHGGGGSADTLVGLEGVVLTSTTGSSTIDEEMIGVRSSIAGLAIFTTVSVPAVYGFKSTGSINNIGGTFGITDVASYYAEAITNSGVTIDNYYGLKLDSSTIATNNWAIYAEGRIYQEGTEAAVVQHTIKAASSQTASLTEWQDSGGNVVGSISPIGEITASENLTGFVTIGASPGATTYGGMWVAQASPDSTNFIALYGNNTLFINNPGTGGLQFRAGNTNRMIISGAGNVLINGFTAPTVGLTIKAASSQTANLQQNTDENDNILSGVDERGIPFADGNTAADNYFAGNNAGNMAAGGTDNVGIGDNVMRLVTGNFNTGIGSGALNDLTSGQTNVAVGFRAGWNITTGSSSFALGRSSLENITTENHNIGIGWRGAYGIVGDRNIGFGNETLGGDTVAGTANDNNIAIGYRSMFTLQAASSENIMLGNWSGFTGPLSRNIFLGHESGYYQTGSDVLLIANQKYADAATELTNSLLYGVMAATPADQTLRVNATLESTQGRIVNTTRQTTTYTALVTDHEIFCDTDGGAFTLTLPVGADGQTFRIINCGSSGNDLTIDGSGAENVRGAATQTVSDSEIMIITFETTEEWW